MTTRHQLELICATVAIVVGGALYLLFRPQTLLMFSVIDALGLHAMVDSLRHSFSSLCPPAFVLNSLPGGLWALSFVLFIDVLFARCHPLKRFLWTLVIPLSGVVSELMQAVGWLPGTFDTADLLCYLLPIAVSFLLAFRSRPLTNIPFFHHSLATYQSGAQRHLMHHESESAF